VKENVYAKNSCYSYYEIMMREDNKLQLYYPKILDNFLVLRS